jgi:hypothetical protein
MERGNESAHFRPHKHAERLHVIKIRSGNVLVHFTLQSMFSQYEKVGNDAYHYLWSRNRGHVYAYFF